MRALAVCGAGIAIAVTLLVLDPYGLFHPSPGSSVGNRLLPMSLQEYARQFPREIRRLVYPYSVVPGGIGSAEDARRAAQSDPVVREHYRGIDLSRLRSVVLGEDRTAYVSYRKGDKIFWTSRKIRLFKGETLLSDGTTLVRARCGNLISDAPMAMASLQEPPEDVLNSPVLPTGPLALLQTPDGLGPLAAPMPEGETPEAESPLPATPNTLIAQVSPDVLPPAEPGTPGAPGSPGSLPPSFTPPGATPVVGAGTPPTTPPTTPEPAPGPGTPSAPGGGTPPDSPTPVNPTAPAPSNPVPTPTPSNPPVTPGTPSTTPPGAPSPSPPVTTTPAPLPPSIAPPPSVPGSPPPTPGFTDPPAPAGSPPPAPLPADPPPGPVPSGPNPPAEPPSTPPSEPTPAPSPVPEPSTWLLAGCGLAVLGWLVAQVRSKQARALLPVRRPVRLKR